MPKQETRTLRLSEIRIAVTNSSPKIRGYAAVFDSEADIGGGYREVIRPGAFTNTLKRDLEADPIRAVWNHNSDFPLASTKNGTLTLEEDHRGLRFEIIPPKTSWGKDVVEAIRSGITDGVSFGFKTIKDKIVNGVRELLEIYLSEISPCTFPAYPDTEIDVRKRGKINMVEQERKIREEMAGCYRAAKEIYEKVRSEKRSLTAAENDQYNQQVEKFDNSLVPELIDMGCDVVYFRDVGLQGVQRYFDQPAGDIPDPDIGGAGYSAKREDVEFRFRGNEDRAGDRYAFNRYLMDGLPALNQEEFRNLQADSDIGGGYLVGPQKFVARLIKDIDNEVFVRKYATIIPLDGAESAGVPTIETDMGDVEWTSELGTGSEDTDLDFGKRELRPYPLARRIRVSNKLMRSKGLDPETIVRQRFAAKFSFVTENAYLNGPGAGCPLGVMVASDNGISTSRDVSTDNTTTAITFDNLHNVVGTLKAGYLRNARWIFHRDAVTEIKKLKDGEGRYIWQANTAGGAPPTILGYPYNLSEYMPNTFTAGLYVGIFGDFSYYWIADSMKVEIQKLVEKYAETNQVGFIGRLESDGMPVNENAFVRVQLAS